MRTITAISTPNAHGGIGVIRMSGDDAIAIADRVFRSVGGRSVFDMKGYSCSYGCIYDENNALVDDIILTVFRNPHSYTGEDVVELSCHGGIYICKKIISILLKHGAVLAQPGEFSKRAFLNGKMTLSQAEAVMNAIHAEGEAALREANLARSGRLSAEMKDCRGAITEMLSAISYWMDDPEETPPELEGSHLVDTINTLIGRLERLSSGYENGRVLREGIRTALLGAPNAGKSSVMNWLSGVDRSIVTDIPGTTRDVITESVRIGDYTLLLADTAGLRETSDAIEALGVQAAYQQAEQAELILYVIDGHVGASAEDLAFLEKNRERRLILLYNKSDLETAPLDGMVENQVVCSAKDGVGYDALCSMLNRLFAKDRDTNHPSLVNQRQKQIVDRAIVCLQRAVDEICCQYPLDMTFDSLEQGANTLAEFDGEIVTDDIISGVFSRFCVGK